MAKIKRGAIIAGEITGMLGDELVFRQRAGQVIVSAPPDFGRNRQWTEAQRGHHDSFRAAVLYGQRVVADAETKAEYARRAQGTPKNAFNLAVSDYMHAPEIEVVDVSGYKGDMGDGIRVRASDDFEVRGVHVRIVDGEGAVIEEGEAAQSADDPAYWAYTATVDTEADHIKLLVSATDRPGHAGVKEVPVR
jgi:hypothetical protein